MQVSDQDHVYLPLHRYALRAMEDLQTRKQGELRELAQRQIAWENEKLRWGGSTALMNAQDQREHDRRWTRAEQSVAILREVGAHQLGELVELGNLVDNMRVFVRYTELLDPFFVYLTLN
jgi:hypothetical protein